MKMISALILFLSLQAFAQVGAPAGCTQTPNFSADAYNAWIAESISIHAASTFEQSPLLKVGGKFEVILLPGVSDASGFVQFTVSEAGTYVLAVDGYPRLDLVDLVSSDKMISTDFGKVHDCDTVRKAVRFTLPAHSFSLKITNSKFPVTNILIWKL